MREVITYAHAYISGYTNLCMDCCEDPDTLEFLPALGPVSHGVHQGSCDICDEKNCNIEE